MPIPPPTHLSLWLLVPLLAALFVAAHEAGLRLRRWNLKREQARGVTDADDAFGGYQGAVMGLMALLIGFTFGMSMDRYNTRRNLVIEETSAISGAYRRLLTLPEPQRTRLADSLIHYLDSREVYSEARDDRELAAAESRSELAGARLWIDGAAELTGKGAPSESGVTLGALDGLLKSAVMRRETLNARVPTNVVRAMLIYAAVAAAFIGYGAKDGRRHFLPSTVQLVLLAVAIGLILDLDTARTGVIRVDETPLVRVAERVRGFESERRKAMGLPPPPARALGSAEGPRAS